MRHNIGMIMIYIAIGFPIVLCLVAIFQMIEEVGGRRLAITTFGLVFGVIGMLLLGAYLAGT